MTWPWQRLRSSDIVVPCKCDSTQPAAPVVTLYNAVKRKFLFWTWYDKIETGGILSCQDCGAMYAWGPSGRFKRGPDAMPQAGRGSSGQAPPPIQRGEPPTDPRPIPKERP